MARSCSVLIRPGSPRSVGRDQSDFESSDLWLGCIPVISQIGETRYSTSLFPKDGIYLVPIKVLVQKAEDVKLGDYVNIRMEVVSGLKGPN